jgi:pyruvate dehydrogenase E2 component (dihydrolipoamide acetyltransferase)
MFEFELPDVGEGVAEGELVAWHVDPGDRVAEDEVLAEVETDKAVVDLPSPVAGVVRELHADPGDIVPVGSVVVTIDTDDGDDEAGADVGESAESADEAGETTADEASETPGGRVFAPPHVRRLARELGVEITGVDGSGPGGRITEADVRAAADEQASAETTSEQATGESDDESATTTADASAGQSDERETKSAITRRDADEANESTDGATAGEAATAGSADRDRTLAAPATRQLARDLGVDLDAVPTEKRRDGEAFVEPEDVRAYAETVESETAQAAATTDSPQASDGDVSRATQEAETAAATDRPVTREPYRGIRRTIGERMRESRSKAPHATHHDTAVVPELVETREALRERASERGTSLTYLPFVLRAVVTALQEYPVLNTTLDEEAEEVVYREYYDIGIAVATDAGLMVPVVEGVGEKGLFELAAEIEDLAARARSRDLAPEELRGSTFTVTNFGAIGGEYATPIINYPETAILGLGALEQRPVVEDGEVVARATLPLSLSIDHRVIDGAEAARFANRVGEYLEHPALLLA